MNEIYLLLRSVLKCDGLRCGSMWRRDTLLGGAICGSCIRLPWRQLAESQQETEVDLRQADRQSERQTVTDK